MIRYKLAIMWADGTVEGYLAEGRSEDDARNQALKMVFEDSQSRGVGFVIIPPADIPSLPQELRNDLRDMWENQANMLDLNWQ